MQPMSVFRIHRPSWASWKLVRWRSWVWCSNQKVARSAFCGSRDSAYAHTSRPGFNLARTEMESWWSPLPEGFQQFANEYDQFSFDEHCCLAWDMQAVDLVNSLQRADRRWHPLWLWGGSWETIQEDFVLPCPSKRAEEDQFCFVEEAEEHLPPTPTRTSLASSAWTSRCFCLWMGWFPLWISEHVHRCFSFCLGFLLCSLVWRDSSTWSTCSNLGGFRSGVRWFSTSSRYFRWGGLWFEAHTAPSSETWIALEINQFWRPTELYRGHGERMGWVVQVVFMPQVRGRCKEHWSKAHSSCKSLLSLEADWRRFFFQGKGKNCGSRISWSTPAIALKRCPSA